MDAISNDEAAEAEQGLRTDFDSSVAFLLTALANKLSIRASQRLRRRLDIGLMEWRIVALLGVEGEATPARVALVAGVDKSVVSRAVATLERRSLISVSGVGQPGRQTVLRLTPHGRDLHARGMPSVVEAEIQLAAGFSEEERRLLIAFLKRMTANVAQMP